MARIAGQQVGAHQQQADRAAAAGHRRHRLGDQRLGLRTRERAWTWDEVVEELEDWRHANVA